MKALHTLHSPGAPLEGIKGGEFLDHLSHYQLFKKDSAT